MKGVREIQPGDVEISVGRMDVFNCAMYQNGLSPIRGIQIHNTTKDPIECLSLMISLETDLINNYYSPLPAIPTGKPVRLPDPAFHVNGKKLAELTEAITVDVKVVLLQGEEVITGERGQITILTYDQWMGFDYCDYLSAFVMPNHPAVSALIHDAAMILSRWQKENGGNSLYDPSLEGYQRNDPNRVRVMAAAAYAAIQKKNMFNVGSLSCQ